MLFHQLSPALVLVTACLGIATNNIPQQNHHDPADAPHDELNAILEEFPFVGKRWLTKDNTCGMRKGGNNHGWLCDPDMKGGGPCCSHSGYCGSSIEYCGEGCQEEFGDCWGKPPHASEKPEPAWNPHSTETETTCTSTSTVETETSCSSTSTVETETTCTTTSTVETETSCTSTSTSSTKHWKPAVFTKSKISTETESDCTTTITSTGKPTFHWKPAFLSKSTSTVETKTECTTTSTVQTESDCSTTSMEEPTFTGKPDFHGKHEFPGKPESTSITESSCEETTTSSTCEETSTTESKWSHSHQYPETPDFTPYPATKDLDKHKFTGKPIVHWKPSSTSETSECTTESSQWTTLPHWKKPASSSTSSYTTESDLQMKQPHWTKAYSTTSSCTEESESHGWTKRPHWIKPASSITSSCTTELQSDSWTKRPHWVDSSSSSTSSCTTTPESEVWTVIPHWMKPASTTSSTCTTESESQSPVWTKRPQWMKSTSSSTSSCSTESDHAEEAQYTGNHRPTAKTTATDMPEHSYGIPPWMTQSSTLQTKPSLPWAGHQPSLSTSESSWTQPGEQNTRPDFSYGNQHSSSEESEGSWTDLGHPWTSLQPSWNGHEQSWTEYNSIWTGFEQESTASEYLLPQTKFHPTHTDVQPAWSRAGYPWTTFIAVPKDKAVARQVARCGPRFRNARCGPGDCCSRNGFCGRASSFCARGCQPRFGLCRPDAVQHCGPTANNLTCPYPQCCSGIGVCGTGPGFCSTPGNCQQGFGTCDPVMNPRGISTAGDPRPLNSAISYDMDIIQCVESGTVALTFDDGPSQYTPQLLDILRRAGAKATFFIAGNNGRGEIDLQPQWIRVIERMVTEGHQVASHGWSHVGMENLTSAERQSEMTRNERALGNIIGKYPEYMRAPYGACSVTSGCAADMQALGYHRVKWTFDTQDWENPYNMRPSMTLSDNFFASLGPDGSAVVIQHDSLRASVEQLTPYILRIIAARGWRAVTLGECLQDPQDNWYRQLQWVDPGTMATRGCVVSSYNFCGRIQPFNTDLQCRASNDACYRDAGNCGVGNDTAHEACTQYRAICDHQRDFCNTCGTENNPSCAFINFRYQVD